VDPLPLDEDFQFVTVLAGAVAAGDGQAGNGHVEDSEQVPPDEVHDGRRRGGIFKIPRAYR
jgi:hypothetical protein